MRYIALFLRGKQGCSRVYYNVVVKQKTVLENL